MMKKADVLAYYKTQHAVAAVLKIKQSAVSQWGEFVPVKRAAQLELITKGALRINPNLTPYWNVGERV